MATQQKNNTHIYIDANNLYQGVRHYFDWRLDYKKFYIFLTERYKTDKVYFFIGYLPEYKWLYWKLQKLGFQLVFKEITKDIHGDTKGNCDADMVLKIVRNYYENKMENVNIKAVLVTGDGDFASTIQFLKEKNALEIVLAPCPPLQTLPNSRVVKPMSFLIRKLNVDVEHLDIYKDIIKK